MKINSELKQSRNNIRFRRNGRKFHKLIYGSSMLFYFISNGIDMRGNTTSYRRTYYGYEK